MLKKTILFFIFLTTQTFLFAQKSSLSLIKTVDSLVFLDQFYRLKAAKLNISEENPISEISLTRKKQLELFDRLENGELQGYKAKRDSLHKLQGKIDIENLKKLKEIILTIGFPGKKLVGHNKAGKLLYHAPIKWVEELFPILKQEVLKGNLRAITLANAYDKILLYQKKEPLYHTGFFVGKNNKLTQTVPTDLEKTNKARKELGLKPIRIKKNGKRKG